MIWQGTVKPICKRCGKRFTPKWLDCLHKFSECCNTCGVRNILDGLGMVTPPELLDRYTLKPTLSEREFQVEIRKPTDEESEP